jgi:putative acyl-CoA dehydrogenase
VQAAHHAEYRRAFGSPLARHPAMANVLADLTLESEAATALAFRLAGAADSAARGDAAEAELLRLTLPAAKHWVCKRAPAVVAEALECLGGNGYVEESAMPRLYRDAPLNSIWEGSGNVTALDMLRALARSPGSADALRAEIGLASGTDRRLDQAAGRLWRELADVASADPVTAQHRARHLAGLITVTLQAALLVRHAPAAVSDAFCASRLAPARQGGSDTPDRGGSPVLDHGGDAGTRTGGPESAVWESAAPAGPGVPFGMLPAGLDLAAVVERSRTVLAR